LSKQQEHRLPPQNLEAEMSVLGAIFLDNSVTVNVASILSVADFFREKHRLIYQAIVKLHQDNDPVDLVSVTSELKNTATLDAVGGSAYLATLVDYVPTSANVDHYCRLVKQASTARKVIESAREIAMQAYDSADPEKLQHSLANLQKVATGMVDNNALLTLKQQQEIYIKHVQTVDESRFITGHPEIDGIIRGVAPGEVMMIMGYSGLFKSAYLQNMLLASGKRNGRHNLFFSLEMPTPRVFERTCQISLEHPTYNVESGHHHHGGYAEQTYSDLVDVGADRLIVCDESALTMERIEHYARIGQQQFGEIGSIAIDYLGLMTAQGMTGEYERISYNAENSKTLAKNINAPVIMLTQVSRESAKDGVVEKWSGKGSGAVEASADYILGLERNNTTKQIFLKILKNRNGEEGAKFEVDIEAKYLKFRGMVPVGNDSVKQSQRGLDRMSNSKRQQPGGYLPFNPED
jgi:replicative DNA helicase